MIVKCKCTHEYQDKKYGTGNRIANKTDKGSDVYRCTVCKSEHTVNKGK